MTDSFQPHPYFERELKTSPPESSGPHDAEQAAMYARGFPPEQHTGQHLQGCRACYRYNDEHVALPASVAEPEGYDGHIDAIERRAAIDRRARERLAAERPTFESHRALNELAALHVTGLVTHQSHRIAFVPKGGA